MRGGGGRKEGGGRTEVGGEGRAQAGIKRSGNPLPHLSTVIEGSPPSSGCGSRDPPRSPTCKSRALSLLFHPR